jgi:FKBP-type peptidyl-prolyl cis-trans isomerase
MRKACVFVALLAATWSLGACKKEEKLPGGAESKAPTADKAGATPPAEAKDIPAPPDVAAPPADAEKTASGLASKVLTKGTGTDKPQYQDKVKVHYTGWTTDGKMFDSSVKRGQPSSFPLRGVIPGWTEGLQLMTVGEKRRFWIPKELAYNDQPGKPAGMLVFDVELLEIIPGPKPIPAPADVAAPPADATKTTSGLFWKVEQKGTGKDHPSAEAYAQFHFTAWTPAGVMLQSSVQNQRPLNIPIDKGVPAWKEILPLMTAGEKVLVWAPEEMAFKGRPGAKPGELTVFELELISFVEPPKAPADVKEPPKNAEKTATGIYSRVLSKGTGKEHPKADDTVEVHYTGWTTDGKMFDSSVTRGKPTRFPLKGVIPGWTEGVQLMVVGEKRRFWIPEELAYKGQQGAPQGTLVFDVELLSINPPPTPPPGAEGAKPGDKPAEPAAKPAEGAAKTPDATTKPAVKANASAPKPAEEKKPAAPTGK